MSLFTKNHWMCLWACVVGAVLSGSSTSGDERASSTRAELFSERGHVARRVVSAGSADCGDGECSTELDENCATCESDCGVCPCDNASTGNCGSGQIGINGGRGECNLDDCWDRNKNGTCDFVDEDLNGDSVCDLQDCFWTGLAFPIETGGAAIDTLRFQLNTNRAGGDIYITGDAGCQPDVKNMLVRMCCGATGQPSGQAVELHFDSVATSDTAPTWVVFVGRPGWAGQDNLGFFNGTTFPAHQVARNTNDDNLRNRAFANLAGPGWPGLWTDMFSFLLGQSYCVQLLFTDHQDSGVFDCVANPDPVGACCGVVSGHPCGECPHDTDGSGDVRVPDLVVLLGCWGSLTGDPDCECLDVDGSGDIGVPDLIALLGQWGTCPSGLGEESTCSVLRGYECGLAGGFYAGDDTTCADCPTTCTTDAGSCCESDGNGTPGCNDPACCYFVCTQVDPFCCSGEWNADCAALAVADENGDPPACGQQDQVCVSPEPEDLTIATGPDAAIDGYLLTSRDELGCAAAHRFGGGQDEVFNPAGAAPLGTTLFSDTLYYYNPDAGERQALCGIINILGTNDDSSVDFEIPPDDDDGDGVPDALNKASDTNGDGVDDTLESTFLLVGAVTNLKFEVRQHVEQVVGPADDAVSVLTQAYTISNLDESNSINFILLRQADFDLFWDSSEDFTNDVVGTGTNANPHMPRYVYQVEDGMPETAVTISSSDGDIYYGAKGGIDPDGDGPGSAFGFGTDVQEWEALGVPTGWANVIAGVGANLDGESGPLLGDPDCDPCDAHIALRVAVSLEPGQSHRVIYQTTYGSTEPF